MHMCNESCKNMQCEVGDQAIGWIEDQQRRKLLIIAIVWRSQGLFSHGTICYRVRDKDGVEYALKDCWVDEAKKDHEEKVLEIVWGIPNVVTLIAAWDVEYEGESNSTLHIHNRHGKFSPGFRSLKAMFEKKVLHGDLSPNNLIIHEGCGFFINFDHAQIIMQCNDGNQARGTMSSSSKNIIMKEQTASDDLESLFYIFVEFVTTYDGPHGKIIYPKMSPFSHIACIIHAANVENMLFHTGQRTSADRISMSVFNIRPVGSWSDGFNSWPMHWDARH
ncbi:hypothetical protein F4604DRAFT_1683751 [Suillus subluteus]|nr:hypothetical protein F4604DRAFT_1683751 [Suillus subluteus]